MSDTSALGDRMKLYEAREAQRRVMPRLPVIARLDGRAFSSFTRDMERPFEYELNALMTSVTEYLVETADGCVLGYTQSDEITLVFWTESDKSMIFFDGRIQKMTSQLAALATLEFNNRLTDYYTEFRANVLRERRPTFDCRVWAVPSLTEAANCVLWRERDATKNSISMAAQTVYSHKELHRKTGNEKQEMLFQKGINWNDYPAFFRRGRYVRRTNVQHPFTVEELEDLPPKHHARTNPDLVVERTVVSTLELPPLGSIQNRVEVLFQGAEPQIYED